jgi:hypothetical protein
MCSNDTNDTLIVQRAAGMVNEGFARRGSFPGETKPSQDHASGSPQMGIPDLTPATDN